MSADQNAVLDRIKAYSDNDVGIPMSDLFAGLRGRLDESSIRLASYFVFCC